MNIKLLSISFLLFLTCLSFSNVYAQVNKDSITSDTSKIYIVIKNDGTEFIGKIISQDAREVLIETKRIGQVIIPKHEIKEIRELKTSELSQDGKYIYEEVFATRYYITTNGLSIEKGESYILWNLYGPEFQFGVDNNLSLGVMTTWLGVPIIGSAKYSFDFGGKASMSIGTLLGTGSWTSLETGGALPYVALTYGDRRSNLTFSLGYGAVFGSDYNEGWVLMSVAGMFKMGKNFSLVFDSFIAPATSKSSSGFALLLPGIRWQVESKKAFQFGFGGVVANGKLLPSPIPIVQLFRKIK